MSPHSPHPQGDDQTVVVWVVEEGDQPRIFTGVNTVRRTEMAKLGNFTFVSNQPDTIHGFNY